ncbi:MAG: CDP-glycerol glycerophosphotransferase family protein [Burkholderiaceae bacterium]|jgi:hypothetical protein|nr:CDP-glycerol glycerophosphotransferase family protein [Burkholderiaceae bacterium]
MRDYVTSLNCKKLAIVFLGLYALPAFAYIDPGTGSAIFYVVSGIVVSIYFALRSAYYRIFEYIFTIGKKDQQCEIAIHCEDPRYETTFLPIISNLIGMGMGVTLFTMYTRDESFVKLPSEVTVISIPPGMLGYAFVNNIRAIVLLTTTPQLDVMTFRRSKKVNHYVIVQHALGESRYVRPFAYDYYDTVFCCGPIAKANIQKMEILRNSKKKRLLNTGVPHYEVFMESMQNKFHKDARSTVLVAPSWGPLSMFETIGIDFISQIAEHFNVIVRPHPQMRISQRDLYEKICLIQGVEVNTSSTPISAMNAADILLSDISGIAQEFAFLYEKPVLIINQGRNLGGLEGELLGGGSELLEICKDFIVPIDPSEVSKLKEYLEYHLHSYNRSHMLEIRDSIFFNYGCASKVAAEQLVEIYMNERGQR